MKAALRCSLVVAALALTLSNAAQGSATEPSASTGVEGFCGSRYRQCCDFTVHNCSGVEGCYCDQLCHWYGDCCQNVTDVCPPGDYSIVVSGHRTATETANSVIVVMADQSKVLRKVAEFRNITAQAVSDLCGSFQCLSYGSGFLGTDVETTGYNVTIASVSRSSPNTSQVVFYVTANNDSVVIGAEDVVAALKANNSAYLKAQFTVYDIIAVPSSENDTNSSSEVPTSTPSQTLSLTTEPSLSLSTFTSSPLEPSTLQPSVSTTLISSLSSSPSSPSPSQVTPLVPPPSHSGHVPIGSPTATPSPHALGSQVIGLIVGGAVGGALITVIIVVVTVTSCVRRLKAKPEQYREIPFSQYPMSEDEGVEVKPRKKGKLVMEYEKLE